MELYIETIPAQYVRKLLELLQFCLINITKHFAHKN